MSKKKSNKATEVAKTVPAVAKNKEAKTAQEKEQMREKFWKTVNVFYDTYKVHTKLTDGGALVFKEVKTFLERNVVTDPAKRPSDDELHQLARKLIDCSPEVMLGEQKAQKAKKNEPTPMEFPDTYALDETTQLNLVKTDDWETIKSLIQDEAITVIALTAWNKTEIEAYKYGSGSNVPPPKDGFPDDFDAVQFILATDYYAVSQSMYTEHAQIFFSTDTKLDENKNRFCGDLPFELYTASTVEPETVETKVVEKPQNTKTVHDPADDKGVPAKRSHKKKK